MRSTGACCRCMPPAKDTRSAAGPIRRARSRRADMTGEGGRRPRRHGLIVLVTIGVMACSTPKSGQPQHFGNLDDTPVQLYTLTNRHGLDARITNFGAIVT